MQIIDAQIHLWAAGLPRNPTHWAVTNFTAEEAIAPMDEGGIDAAVIHPPDRDPGAMELALKAMRDYPGTAISAMPCSWRQCATMGAAHSYRGLTILPGGTPASLCVRRYSAASSSRSGPVGPQTIRRWWLRA